MSCYQPSLPTQDLEQDGLRLLGKRPNVSYFIVFGSKCFILNKKPKSSKFAPKIDEGFLLGYASNAHGYRVFNKTSGCVEVACDVTFDESNGSQGEQVIDIVRMEEPSNKAIQKLATCEVKPKEQVDQDEDDGLMFHGPSTSTGQTIRTNEEPSTSNQDQP